MPSLLSGFPNIIRVTSDTTIKLDNEGNVLVLCDASSGSLSISFERIPEGNIASFIKTDSSTNVVEISGLLSATLTVDMPIVQGVQTPGTGMLITYASGWGSSSSVTTVPPHNHDDRYYTETEVDNLLSTKADATHNHDDRYYTETEVDNFLSQKASVTHNHDDRYYTETEVDNLLATKAPLSHSHDDRYYTKSEVDSMLDSVTPGSHTHSVSDINFDQDADVQNHALNNVGAVQYSYSSCSIKVQYDASEGTFLGTLSGPSGLANVTAPLDFIKHFGIFSHSVGEFINNLDVFCFTGWNSESQAFRNLVTGGSLSATDCYIWPPDRTCKFKTMRVSPSSLMSQIAVSQSWSIAESETAYYTFIAFLPSITSATYHLFGSSLDTMLNAHLLAVIDVNAGGLNTMRLYHSYSTSLYPILSSIVNAAGWCAFLLGHWTTRSSSTGTWIHLGVLGPNRSTTENEIGEIVSATSVWIDYTSMPPFTHTTRSTQFYGTVRVGAYTFYPRHDSNRLFFMRFSSTASFSTIYNAWVGTMRRILAEFTNPI